MRDSNFVLIFRVNLCAKLSLHAKLTIIFFCNKKKIVFYSICRENLCNDKKKYYEQVNFINLNFFSNLENKKSTEKLN